MRKELYKLAGKPNSKSQQIRDRIKHFNQLNLPDDEDKFVANNNLLGK
jgi:hypothetical protein